MIKVLTITTHANFFCCGAKVLMITTQAILLAVFTTAGRRRGFPPPLRYTLPRDGYSTYTHLRDRLRPQTPSPTR